MSQRDGWAHLYLYDRATGQVKNQITKGNWQVNFVDRVDEQSRQIYFHGNGMDAGKDPYFMQFFRVNFDGTGLTRLTTADATHHVELVTGQAVLRRHLLTRRFADGHRAAPGERSVTRPGTRESRRHGSAGDRLAHA